MRKLFRALWLILSFPFRLIRRFFGALAQGFQTFFVEEPEDTPLGDTVQKAVENPGDLLIHLAALRGHLVRVV